MYIYIYYDSARVRVYTVDASVKEFPKEGPDSGTTLPLNLPSIGIQTLDSLSSDALSTASMLLLVLGRHLPICLPVPRDVYHHRHRRHHRSRHHRHCLLKCRTAASSPPRQSSSCSPMSVASIKDRPCLRSCLSAPDKYNDVSGLYRLPSGAVQQSEAHHTTMYKINYIQNQLRTI